MAVNAADGDYLLELLQDHEIDAIVETHMAGEYEDENIETLRQADEEVCNAMQDEDVSEALQASLSNFFAMHRGGEDGEGGEGGEGGKGGWETTDGEDDGDEDDEDDGEDDVGEDSRYDYGNAGHVAGAAGEDEAGDDDAAVAVGAPTHVETHADRVESVVTLHGRPKAKARRRTRSPKKAAQSPGMAAATQSTAESAESAESAATAAPTPDPLAAALAGTSGEGPKELAPKGAPQDAPQDATPSAATDPSATDADAADAVAAAEADSGAEAEAGASGAAYSDGVQAGPAPDEERAAKLAELQAKLDAAAALAQASWGAATPAQPETTPLAPEAAVGGGGDGGDEVEQGGTPTEKERAKGETPAPALDAEAEKRS